MSKNKPKVYVVWAGYQPGIYKTWEACQKQINGFPDAKYKAFANETLAQKAFSEGYAAYYTSTAESIPIFATGNITTEKPITESIAVDAACDMQKRIMEYRGVYTKTRKVIFAQGPFEQATNNIGEFLAIVHALAHCKKHNIQLPIYTDSITALTWVDRKKANTKQEATEINAKVFDLIERAEKWLIENTYTNKLLKWDTQAWGEIPADYGRK